MSGELRDQALQHLIKAESQITRGHYGDALMTLEKAEQFANDVQSSDILSIVMEAVGRAMQFAGMYYEALESYTIALKIQEELAKKEPFFNTCVATTLNNLGALLARMGRVAEAKKRFECALEIRERLLGGAPKNVTYQSDVAMTLNNLGNLLADMGRVDEAKKQFECALEIRERLLGGAPKNVTYQSDVAMTLNDLGNLLARIGRVDEAREMHEGTLKTYERLLGDDPENGTYQSYVATSMNNLGALLADMGRVAEAKKRFECALEIRERLLGGDPKNVTYQLCVAMSMNNLGNSLVDLGRIEEAEGRYESALEMYEILLEGDSENITYQSDVAMTLNNLGNLFADMGRVDEARRRYERSLDIYTEPMQHITVQAKSRAIINIIQLTFRSAEEETNRVKKQKHFGEVYAVYNRHKAFFTSYNLEYEHLLVREAGLGAHIQYLMLNAEAETDAGKRTGEYASCAKELGELAETEDDAGLRELLLSVMHYFEGRRLINEAIKFEPPDRELTEQAVDEFKRAKDRYKHANICYCIYTVLLELESVKVLDDAAITRLKGLLHTAIDGLPEKMDETIKSAFGEIELLLEMGCVKVDPGMFVKLNRCITKIDYYALGAHFTHISEKIVSYLKEPFSPEVEYGDWNLKITFPEPDKVTGKLTINAGDNVLFDEPLGIRNTIRIKKHRPRVKKETITFTDGTGKTVTRPINYSDEIKCDDGYVDVHILQHDCEHGSTSDYFNIAIVQLKYHLYKEGSAIKVRHGGQYLNKIRSILDAVKGKANLIVFPEFSIPFDYLPEFKQYSDANGIAIIAGSHYVTDANLDKYGDLFDSEFGEFGARDLLKNISPVIIPSSKKILHTEKVLAAKVERALFSEEGMAHGDLNRIFKLRDDVTCGIMICFDFLDTILRQRITDACNIILVPQSNPVPWRFHGAGKMEIDNPRGSGNKAYIMASGIFTFGNDEGIMGGDSGVILTLDKASRDKQEDGIIKSVGEKKIKEQFVLLSSLNMNFFAARDTQHAQTPILTKLIHIFEENEILNSEKDKPQAFLDLFKKIWSCEDRNELKKLLKDNESLIQDYSPLMHKYISEGLENLKLEQIKDKCCAIVIK